MDIQYSKPDSWVSQPEMMTIAAGGLLEWDLQASSVITDGFAGAAAVSSMNGAPLAVVATLRGGSRQATSYGGLPGGAAAGDKLYLPLAYKNLSDTWDDQTWSSTIAFHAFEASQVNLTFHDVRNGASWTAGSYSVLSGSQFDLSSHASTEGHSDFQGSITVEVVSGNVGAIVQTLGSGATGDTLMSYQAASSSLTPGINPAAGFAVYTQSDVNCAAPQYTPVARAASGQDVGDFRGWSHDWYICTEGITSTCTSAPL